jgi:hypothetical protein
MAFLPTKKNAIGFFVSLALVYGCLIFPVSKASASSCERLTPVEHIEITQIIFLGIPDKEAGGPRDNKDRVVSFQVLRAYKGFLGPTVKVKYMNDHGGNSGWGFLPGRTTLVFAQSLADFPESGADALVHFCNMIMFHANGKPHATEKRQAEYWRLINSMKP